MAKDTVTGGVAGGITGGILAGAGYGIQKGISKKGQKQLEGYLNEVEFRLDEKDQ